MQRKASVLPDHSLFFMVLSPQLISQGYTFCHLDCESAALCTATSDFNTDSCSDQRRGGCACARFLLKDWMRLDLTG